LMGRTVMSEACEEHLCGRVIEHYGAEHLDFPHRVRFYVTGCYVERHLVMGAHILPVSSQVGSLLLSRSAVLYFAVAKRTDARGQKAIRGSGTHIRSTPLTCLTSHTGLHVLSRL
jgi:hypothetical protein